MDKLSTTLLGQGIVFPVEIENGSSKLETGKKLIRQSLVSIIFWPYRYRYFMGHYGSKIEQFIERPLDDITLDLLRESIISAVNKFEKRVTLRQVDIEVDRDNGTAKLLLSYLIKHSDTVDSFIVPLYSRIRH